VLGNKLMYIIMIKNKISLLLTITLIAFHLISNAQKSEMVPNYGFGFGFSVTQIQKDFGLGLNIISPYFANHKIALRIKGNMMFNENIQESSTTWTPYSNVSLGIIGVGGMVGGNVRLYGEGGMIGLFPSKEFSDKEFVMGGYGQLGFEFFLSNGCNYFIEIGGVGTGANAEKIENKPFYSNGLLVGAGFRMFMK